MTNYIGAEEADYELMEWEPLAIMSSDTRALQFNPRTTPVEDHYELEWSDFQDLAEDQGLQRFPMRTPRSRCSPTISGKQIPC